MTTENSVENVETKKTIKKYHSDLLLLEPNLGQEPKFKFKKRYLICGISTIILFTLALTLVGIQQTETTNLILDNKNETLDDYANFCNILDYSNLNLISHPFSALLILVYMFLFWRRSCCLRCLFARPGPPMIIHPFKKTNRLFTAVVYGAISFEVTQIVFDAILKSSASDVYSQLVYDPSGLFKLTIRLIEVLLASLRYYPPLIAFCADSLVIYATSAIYMAVDYANNIYTEGRCEILDVDNETIKLIQTSIVPVTLIKDIPQFFLISLIFTVLTCRTILIIIDMIKKKTNTNNRLLINEDERFYSIHDLKYCLDLYNNKKSENLKKNFLKRFLYDWNENFKFSSRIINSHVVALLSLTYFFIEWTFLGIIFLKSLIGSATGSITDLLDVFGDLNIQITFNQNLLVLEHHIAGFVVAVVLSYFICLIQVFLGLRAIQQNLLSLYKGKKEDIALLKSNASVSNGNTHFAGFLVGFLLNGFLFIFAFLFLIIIVIYYLVQFSTWEDISPILLKLVPILVVFVVKFIFNFVCSRFIFLQERSKVLALDNFRAYSVFVYVTFFFDCFVGAINALVRLILGILGSLFFMPRVGYSFLGRQIEKFDGGFRVSAGYYQMEYTHSHPVLLSFCALLYWKRFLKRIEDYNSNDIVYAIRNRKNKIEIIKVEDVEEKEQVESKKVLSPLKANLIKQSSNGLKRKSAYDRRILNKWFLIVTLVNNPNLVPYRKEKSSHRKLNFLSNYSTKIENKKDK
ncbi:unnamed protein product [Brachionus calyciflorus]|uniref:Uncharacterized protein n=1 Tax=Brachionus calyciflorus TaxID=104777 RepID=A0A813TDZ2_9BILA|nr:unnamed protein product [Brachionus calyciflorus]